MLPWLCQTGPREHEQGTSEKSPGLYVWIAHKEGIREFQEVTLSNKLPHSPIFMAAGVPGRGTEWSWMKQKVAGPRHQPFLFGALATASPRGARLLV